MTGSLNGFLRHIHICNPVIREPFLPWLIDGQVAGWVRPGFANRLLEWDNYFHRASDGLVLSDSLASYEQRSAALAEVLETLSAELAAPLLGELYPVTASSRDQALCEVDRNFASYFGIRSFGQHMNAYVRKDGELLMWIGKRASDRKICPGKLDNMVAGGLPAGSPLISNLIKESDEEAGLSEQYARQAIPVGLVTYTRVTEHGLRPDVLYCYDLELPEDFVPRNLDGEVERFLLLPIKEVTEIVRRSDDFKLNCNLVLIDFLIRHGLIEPEDPDYLSIITGLRARLDFTAPMAYSVEEM